jgi:chromosomal replication initiator protein
LKTSQEELATVLEASLGQRIGKARYDLWFANKTRFACHDDGLVVGVANLMLQDWLKKNFGSELQEAANEALGEPAAVRYVIDPELFQAARAREAQAPAPAVPHAALPPPVSRRLRPRRWRRLDEFVVGPCNRVAHASAQNLVEAPDDHPSPLVVHGAVGTGKTHLLEGVYSGLAEQNQDWRIAFVTAEEFTNRFVQAVHQSKLGAFRKQYRECDALLLDDVHFLAKKQATQEEFLHTLDALQAEQRPVILTCDCHPRLADHFMPELTDRLVGGAVWGVTTPDHATRMGLLRAKAQLPLPDVVVTFLAENLAGNVRELEGALNSVMHLSRVTRRPLDIALVREALGDVLRHSVRLVQLDDVEKAVCAGLGIQTDLLRSKKRGWLASQPRMLAMYLARKHTRATYSEVGKHFGGRNHSTVVAGEKRVRQWLAANATLQVGAQPVPVRDLLERIERHLGQ